MRTSRLILGVATIAAMGSLLLSAPKAIGSGPAVSEQASPIYEVRTYHFDPARFDEYAEVARGEYLRYLRENLDVVGFFIGTDIPSEVRGAPQDELGSGNVTWIIRWDSKAERDEKLPQVLGTPEWQEIFAAVPGGGGSYQRIEVRFMESLF